MADENPRRRQLRQELLRLRDLAGVSGRKMAEHLGVKQGTVYRLDHGITPFSMQRVRAWLGACGVDDETRDRVLTLAEAAMGETRPWAEMLEDRDHLQDVAREMEASARLVQNFQPVIVPGLLQTEDYARSVFRLGHTKDVEAAVKARLERQHILLQPGRRFEFLITDEVLTSWAPGPQALVGQADKVLSLASLETVRLAVLPVAALPVVPWHGFILNYPADSDDEPLVTTEQFHGRQVITDPKSVQLYRDLWARLWESAVSGDAARELLAKGVSPG